VGNCPRRAADESELDNMKTEYDDFRFVYARRLLSDPEIWRRPAEIAFANKHLNMIAADQTETMEKRDYAEKVATQLCMAGKQPKVTYTSTTAQR
jgi:hypothetical protein